MSIGQNFHKCSINLGMLLSDYLWHSAPATANLPQGLSDRSPGFIFPYMQLTTALMLPIGGLIKLS